MPTKDGKYIIQTNKHDLPYQDILPKQLVNTLLLGSRKVSADLQLARKPQGHDQDFPTIGPDRRPSADRPLLQQIHALDSKTLGTIHDGQKT